MDHGKKYWFKQTYEQQKKDILLEFTELVKRREKTEYNVKLLMNRCIKYTNYSIEDPKNSEIKSKLEQILEIEKTFKENPHDEELEKQILVFFDKTDNVIENAGIKVLADFTKKTTANYFETIMSIIQYDSDDQPVQALTGAFQSVFSKIDNVGKYYYRIAALKQHTIRDRVKGEHFGVGTSCIGGLRFDISEAMNRYLNYLVKQYIKGESESFYFILTHFQWYSTLIRNLNKNDPESLEKQIKKIRNCFPELEEIKDLNEYRERAGIYILVLDSYNVCYVGQAQNIKQRIMQHWSRSNYFTGTGIDLFKAYDTTRIFVLPCESNDLNVLEYKIVKMIEERYSLNNFAGGTVQYHIDNDLPLLKESHIDVFGEIFNMFDEISMFADKFIVSENDFRLKDFKKI